MVPHIACYTRVSDASAKTALDIHVGHRDDNVGWVLAAVSIMQVSIYLHDIS